VRLNGLAEWFARNRILLIGLMIAMTIVAIFGLFNLGFDDQPLNIFKTNQADFELLEELFDDFGSDDNDCIILVESSQIFSSRGASLLKALSAEFKKIERIESVRSLSDVVVIKDFGSPPASILPAIGSSDKQFEAAYHQSLAHPLIGGHLLSSNGQSALIVARIEGNSPTISELKPTVLAIQDAIDRVPIPDDFARVRLTGVPPIRYEIFSSIRRDSVRFMLIGTALAFIMATILFRSFWAVIAVATPPLLAAMWTVGLLGLLGEKFNVINTILPVLVMIVGFTDSVHLMFDVRHSLARGLSPLEAAKSAIEHLGVACALTSFTTAVGFASLMVTNVEVIQKLGMICGIGAVLAFVSTIIMVPLFASSRIGHLLAVPKKGSGPNSAEHPKGRSGYWGLTPFSHINSSRLEGWIRRASESAIDVIIARAALVTALGILAVVVLSGLVTRLEPNNRLTDNIPDTNDSAQALFHIDENFGGTLPGFVVVDWDESLTLDSDQVLGVIGEVQRAIEDQAGANHPISILNLLQTMPGTRADLKSRVPFLLLAPQSVVNRFVRMDRRRATVAFFVPDKGTGVHEPMFRAIENKIAEIENRYQGISLNLTGTVVVASRNINQMITDLAKSVGLATIVIFVTMTLVFRSWKLGLISMLPNAFPLLTTAAWLVLTGRPLELTSVIVFSICLGIAVDDTIHVINRFQRELRNGLDVPPAIKNAFIAVGSALATTTIILIVGFGSVAASEMPTSQLFAKLGMIAIFAALIGDLIILPAMLVFFLPRDFGNANSNDQL
jgi:predicted RND superfamily exporter protein